MGSIPVIPMAGDQQAAVSTFINRVYEVNEDGTVGPRLDHILDDQAAELAGKANNSYGILNAPDLLAWAASQTVGGAFTINPAITSSGLPHLGWFLGRLDVNASSDKTITLYYADPFNKEVYFNGTSSGAFSGWTPLATATPPQEYDLPLAGVFEPENGFEVTYSKDQFGVVRVALNSVQGMIPYGTFNLAALPVGFRPNKTTDADSFMLHETGGATGLLRSMPDGTIYVINFGAVQCRSVHGQITFMASSYGPNTLHSEVHMAMLRTRVALPTESTDKCMCVVDSDGNYKEFVLVTISQDEQGLLHTVHYYELKDGERLVDAEHPTMRPHAGANGFIKPRWNGTEWTESATPEEITTWELEHPAPPVPAPSIYQRISDLEDAYTADKFGGAV